MCPPGADGRAELAWRLSPMVIDIVSSKLGHQQDRALLQLDNIIGCTLIVERDRDQIPIVRGHMVVPVCVVEHRASNTHGSSSVPIVPIKVDRAVYLR